MSIEGIPNNEEVSVGGFQDNEDREEQGQVKKKMNILLERLRDFEEVKNEIASQVRKLKRDWEKSSPKEKEKIKVKMKEAAARFKDVKNEREKTEDKLKGLEDHINPYSTEKEKERA